MTPEELKRKKGLRPVYFKAIDLASMDIDLTKREVIMAWNAFGNKDSDGDVVMKGAFAKSINERGPKSTTYRKIAYLKYHNYNLPIGPVKEIYEDDKYLVAKAVIDPTPEGDTTLTQYQTGTLNQHSIGYRYIWDKMEYDEQNDAFIIKELDLWEGSAVVAGANENTPLLELRGMNAQDQILQAMDDLEKMLRSVEIKNQYDIRKTISKLLYLSENNTGKEEQKKQQPTVVEINYERIAMAMKAASKVN